MSEKNEQTGLWPKSVSVSALAGTQKQQLQRQVSDYSISGATLDMVPLSLTSPSAAARNIVYDNTFHHSSLRPEDVSYTTARFQTPLINHALTSTSAALVATPQTIASNVPAPSGFLPSSFASASTALTANQYAAPSTTDNNQSTTPQITGQRILFGVEQFHNLNSQQQQYEFSKLMASSFSTAQSSAHLPVTSGNNPTTSSAFRQNHSAQEQTTSGAIPSQIAEQVISAISSGGGGATKLTVAAPHGRLLGLGVRTLDDEKLKSVQQVVESGVSEHAKQQVMQILDRISTLRPVEKLLLYLRLPGEMPETDPLRQPQNPLGTRSEINHTINWVRTHLEQDPQVSIPKQDVYNDYLLYCDRLDIKPLSTADFGKVMKQVFPGIRPRRLGTRGHSRYCYAAMRKTSKLPAPHLPTICSTTSSAQLEVEKNCPDNNNTSEDREQYWPVIKQWAESILHAKVENFIDLANHVKHQLSGTHTPNPGSTRATATQKKHQNKEKRLLADMGPLKKRRKKKRKGSSSSESSYNQQQTQEQQLTPSNSPKFSQQSVCSPAEEDGQKNLKMIKIKQEVMDTSIYPAVLTHPNLPQIVEPSLQQQTELMPMNLAAESREGIIDCSVLGSRAPPTPPPPLRASESQTTTTVGAVKNLTPRIIEISSLEEKPPANILPAHIQIKEEVIIDDYSTSNIFCKKVLKAQQTKGFWVNSPKPAATPVFSTTTALPIITTTASTPPPTSGGVTTSPPHTASSNFSMGPPTSQMAPSVSPHCYNLQDDSGNNCPPQAKVLSRNLQQLRAKKLLAAAATACDPADVSIVKDTDLPENLGLPRERVISICNMDKHELDDYFLPVEEENSEDQETELLQYFQMGDAEEKLNRNPSSDAASNKNNSNNNGNSTVVTQVTSSATVTSAPLAMATMSNNKMTPQIPVNKMNASAQVMSTAARSGSVNKIAAMRSGISNNVNLLSTTYDAGNTPSSVLTPPATVGSASASLTQLSQKHHQQKRQQLNHHEQQVQEKLAIKRKVNVNALTATPDINATRKNYSFLPISPNINTTSLSAGSGLGNNGSFFASPSMSRLLTKQHSLDCDSSDPMIGSGRRKRSYFNVTSASAPPSPSLLNKKQEQLHGTSKSILIGPWLAQGGMCNGNFRYNDNATGVASVSTSMLTDQNSLDLDLFGETSEPVPTSCCNKNSTHATLHTADIGITGADVFNVLNEVTQRSQSVPLSQLQRSHSPNFNRCCEASTANAMCVYSACPSQTQTPIPTDFGDSTTMLSENSCSQQSGTIKLEEVGGVVASDTTVILDEVDVNEILSSPDFVTKFSSLNQSSTPIATCSSIGSSSGYSSAGNFTASINSNISARSVLVSGMSATVSRSVPSTPIPHLHNQHNIFSSVRRIYDRNTQAFNTVSGNNRLRYTESNNNYTCRINSGSYLLSRSNCDISKSMPSTPITITSGSFRYSPSEITNDLFINGHTLDESISSTFSGVDNENLMGADVVGINAPLTREPMLTNNEDFVNDSKKSPNDLNILNFATQPVPDTPTLSDTAMLMTSELLDNL